MNALNTLMGGQDFGGSALNTIFNQLFWAGLVIAVILAVVMIVAGGIQYMTTDAISGKEDGKEKIRAALGGLLLAFSTVVILNTINPSITEIKLGFQPLQQVEVGVTGLTPLSLPPRPENTDPAGAGASFGQSTGSISNMLEGKVLAQITQISNPTIPAALATGFINLNGVSYSFRSGGFGGGYLPRGIYTISNPRRRIEYSFSVGGYGYSFDVSDKYDPRLGRNRTLLRIHPDGGSPGTLGCIGIVGNAAVQQQFYENLRALVAANGGSYTLVVN